ncbi:MAG: J domain-containing protein [Betaproteobacteria bacterium]
MQLTHYDSLKIARDAPIEVIRAAYRALSQKYHPDRNPDDLDAAANMARLNAAYEVLADPQKRAEYDASLRIAEAASVDEREMESAYAPRRWTREFRSPDPADEGHKMHIFVRRTVIPLGTIAVLVALVWYIATELHRQKEIPEITAAVPYEFQDPTMRSDRTKLRTQRSDSPARSEVPPTTSNPSTAVDGAVSAQGKRFLDADDALAPPPDKPAVRAKSPNIAMKAAPPKRTAAVDAQQTKPRGKANGRETPGSTTPGKNAAYVRPATAPNGEGWPSTSDYVPGYEQLDMDGLSQVTIDNSKNDFDAFVKVISLAEGEPRVVRTLYVSASDRFAVKELPSGTYELRYELLDSGVLLRSGVFTLEESAISNGTRYSMVTLTLRRMPDDNVNTYALSEHEFFRR